MIRYDNLWDAIITFSNILINEFFLKKILKRFSVVFYVLSITEMSLSLEVGGPSGPVTATFRWPR